MRKALIAMILTATAATPVAALAQDEGHLSDEAIQRRVEQRQARSQQRVEQRVERRQERVEPRIERRQERFEARQTPQVQAQPDPQVRAFNRRGERNLRNSTGGVSADPRLHRRDRRPDRDHDHDSHRGDHRGDHGELHRDLRREHRELHRGDPSRREHREWHRDADREHRQVHRDTHRDLHDRGVTRREHRRFHREWDRHSWRGDRRYDWRDWRFRNRSLFRLSPYYSPYRSHRYSRFSIGLFLEPLFYSQRYWIGDPWQYRLPYAPPGTQWVRYYNDVLLVDVYSGEVIDVIYDFFW